MNPSLKEGDFLVRLKDYVVDNSIREIKMHGLIASLLRQKSDNLSFHINFHIGSKFDVETAKRFCNNFMTLPEEIKQMVIIENDDKANCWSISKLYKYIHKIIKVPLTFDHHHSFFSREPDITAYDEFMLAKLTWENKSDKQEVHFSTSQVASPKHSDYILSEIPEWLRNDKDIYIHFETKQKELAVLDYRQKYGLI